MLFTVRELLKLDILKDARVVTGGAGLGNEITGVTIIEAPDIAKYIGGGEVLLTSLYPFSTCTREEYAAHIDQICEKCISAMVLKVGRQIKSADALASLLVDKLGKNRIPVIEIPLEIAYRDITYPIMERLFNEEVTKMRYFKETNDRFMSLSFALPFSDSRFKKILDYLAELIGNPVALFDKNLACIVTTDDTITQMDIPQNCREIEIQTYTKYAFFNPKIMYGKSNDERYYQIIAPMNNAVFNMNMYLVITEVNSAVGQLDYIAIGNAATAILLETVRSQTILEHEEEFKNNLFEQILGGKIRSRDKLNLSANLLGLPLNSHYCVLVFSVGAIKNNENEDYSAQVRYNKILHDSIALHFSSINMQNNSNNIVVLQELGDKQRRDNYINEVKAKIEKVQANVCGNPDNCIIHAGIGSLVEGVMNIPKSFKEAADTLFIIETIENAAHSGSSRVAHFSELGILKMFTYFDDPAVLNSFVPESLKKLYEHNKPGKDELLVTLQSYLNNNQNIAKTAQDLYVHYKTAAYRINRIKTITGIDFNDADQVLSVHIGMIILRLIGNYNGGGV